MLGGAGGAAVLEIGTLEALAVVADAHVVVVIDAPVDFPEIDVLVEAGDVGLAASEQVLSGRGLGRGDRRGKAEADRDADVVALAVIVEEEEQLVLEDGAADVSAELVVVISGLDGSGGAEAVAEEGQLLAVDLIVCVEAAIAEELKDGSVKFICA